MDPTDLADVTGYAFLVNGKGPDENATLLFKKGERVRLRLINGAAMTFFDVRIPGLKMTVVAADGNDVNPVPVDELRIGVAERYDVIVTPTEDIPYALFAESLDRMGYAMATLAPREGVRAETPARRPRTMLTMDDMGMDHGSMDMGGMKMDGMDHAAMGHDMGAMKMDGMDHAAMGHDMANMGGGDAGDASRPQGWGAGFPSDARVLRYEDLKALRKNADTGEPTRTIELRLTGNMERYVWTLNDKRFDAAEPIRVAYGERVRLKFVNETMMAHPMHLHGMFFELENGQTDRKPVKDTVIVPPGKTVSVVLTAREVGGWPLHCHLLYHMASGMMTTFVVEPPGSADLTPDGAVVPVAIENPNGMASMPGMSHAGHGAQ
jgi:CopA family copper-resistance protein